LAEAKNDELKNGAYRVSLCRRIALA